MYSYCSSDTVACVQPPLPLNKIGVDGRGDYTQAKIRECPFLKNLLKHFKVMTTDDRI